jgi:hypothetical protein
MCAESRPRALEVSDPDRLELQRRLADRGALARDAMRARIVVLSTEGLSGPRIAERLGCSGPTVVLWRRRHVHGAQPEDHHALHPHLGVLVQPVNQD